MDAISFKARKKLLNILVKRFKQFVLNTVRFWMLKNWFVVFSISIFDEIFCFVFLCFLLSFHFKFTFKLDPICDVFMLCLWVQQMQCDFSGDLNTVTLTHMGVGIVIVVMESRLFYSCKINFHHTMSSSLFQFRLLQILVTKSWF